MFDSTIFGIYGGIKMNRWFVLNFGTLPQRVIIRSKKEGSGISFNGYTFFEKISKEFPNFEYITSRVMLIKGETYENLEEPIEGPRDLDFTGFDVELRLGVEYGNSTCIFYYEEETPTSKAMLERIREIFSESKELVIQKSKINLITYNGDNYELTECNVASDNPVDIKKHYNDDFEQVANIVDTFLDDSKSGLVIAHGHMGTGKTNWIRHLIHNHDKSFIIVNNSLMNSISDPVFMKFILDHKDSVLILEDCEQLLEDRSHNAFNNGIANILNMTDGIYSDILNIKILATMNSDTTKIDSALLRKGRLVAKYEFGPLCLEKTNAILTELGKPLSTVPMTLAQIYNYDDISYEERNKVRRPIGF